MNRPLIALLALGLSALAQAAEPSVAEKTGAAVQRGAAKTGEVVGTTVERTKAGVKKGADRVKKGAKRAKAAVTPASVPN